MKNTLKVHRAILAFKLAKLFKVRIEELFIYEEKLIKPASGESYANS